ncbi:hypothetical protein RCIP0099_00008 [Klebsiella phage RCIP0099]
MSRLIDAEYRWRRQNAAAWRGRISVLESTLEHFSALQSLTPNQVTTLVSMRIEIARLKGHIKAGT